MKCIGAFSIIAINTINAIFFGKSLDSTNANAYVDELLARARPLIQEKLEPVELPEYSLKISQSIIITDVEGEFDQWSFEAPIFN